jgi:hydroxyacylglutathione hydrolase
MLLKTLTVGPLACNCCIVADEVARRAVVIDPGGDFSLIEEALRSSDLKVEAILHTHAHIDHVGATAPLQRATGACARVHEADLFVLGLLNVQAAMVGIAPPDAANMQGDLRHGTLIEVGSLRFEVIHTPGHSPGSVCLLLKSEQQSVLFSGDTLFRAGIGRSDLWGGDSDALERSIRDRLYTLDEQLRVIPGHGEQTTIGEERRSNPFVRSPHT